MRGTSPTLKTAPKDEGRLFFQKNQKGKDEFTPLPFALPLHLNVGCSRQSVLRKLWWERVHCEEKWEGAANDWRGIHRKTSHSPHPADTTTTIPR